MLSTIGGASAWTRTFRQNMSMCPRGVGFVVLTKGREQGCLLICYRAGAYYALKPCTAAVTHKFVRLRRMGTVLHTCDVPRKSTQPDGRQDMGRSTYSIRTPGYQGDATIRGQTVAGHQGLGLHGSRRGCNARPVRLAPGVDASG